MLVESAIHALTAARPLSAVPGALASSTAIGANAFIAGTSGTNILSMVMFPNVVHGAMFGYASSAFKKGDRSFHGVFGYKTLLRGVQNGRDNVTSGGMILPLVNLGARGAYMMGARGARTVAAQSASQLGFGGVMSATSFSGEKAANVHRVLSQNKFAWAGGAEQYLDEVITGGGITKTWKAGAVKALMDGEIDIKNAAGKSLNLNFTEAKARRYVNEAFDATESLIGENGRKFWQWGMQAGGKDATDALRKGEWLYHGVGKKGGAVVGAIKAGVGVGATTLKAGSKWAAGLRWFGVIDMLTLGVGAASWAGGQLLEGAAAAISYGIHQSHQAQRLDLGDKYMSPVFAGPGASTERRRAVQSIYGARVNPNERMYGNEARYNHR